MLESEAGVQKLLRDRIAECLRRHPKLRQANIARACKVRTPSVVGWINGDTKTLKSDTARLAAVLFGCDQNWLATGVGMPNWVAPNDLGSEGDINNLSEAQAQVRPVRSARMARMRMLVDEAGSMTEVERLTGTPRSHIGAMVAGTKGLGDDLATRLEQAFGKPFGWMDWPLEGEKRPEQPSPRATIQALAQMVATIPFDARVHLAELIGSLVRAPDSAQLQALSVLALSRPEGDSPVCVATRNRTQP